MNQLLTCYLTGRPDPQRRINWAVDDPKIVRAWIESVRKLGLSGVIFHDRLSLEFTRAWTDQHVTFQHVEWKTPWTAAEERVQIYLDWLGAHPWCDKVMTTDLSDVEFHRDPFPLLTDSGVVYIGSEENLIGKTCLVRWMEAAYKEVSFPGRPVLNPGIVGGLRAPMLWLLRLWLVEMRDAVQPTPPPHDITAFNRLIYRDNFRYVTGPPLHTRFQYGDSADYGAAIKHK